MTPANRTWALVAIVAVAVVGFAVWLGHWERPEPQLASEPVASATPAAPASSAPAVPEASPATSAHPAAPPESSTAQMPVAPIPAPAAPPTIQLPSEQLRIEVDTELESVQGAVRSFRNELGENPIGTNAEITRALLGDNLKQVKVPVPPGSQVNGNGELCDRWGTPYFFHQVSHDRMEVRSAGEDRKMWTDDDLELK